MPTSTSLSLKSRALRLLAQREHSRLELYKKLSPYVEEGDDLDSTLDALEAKGFISAERVAESIIHSKASRFGSARLLQELRSKGLSNEVVENASATLNASELQRAQALWFKRFNAAPVDAREKAKQLRFLAARGFSWETACRVLKDVSNPDLSEMDSD